MVMGVESGVVAGVASSRGGGGLRTGGGMQEGENVFFNAVRGGGAHDAPTPGEIQGVVSGPLSLVEERKK